MALTTQAKIEQRLQWDITAEPDPVVAGLIAAATAHMEAEVGRPLESAGRVEIFDGGAWALFLTYWPVTAIASIDEDGTVLASTDFQFYPRGKVIRTSSTGYWMPWRGYKPRSIEVTYTGGYLAGTHDSELDHLGSICTEIVARAFRRGAESAAVTPGAGSIQSVSLDGSDSVTYATGSGSSFTFDGSLLQFVFLTEDERRQLSSPRYRRISYGVA